MGVLGLWKLIDAAGKPVPVETLEGKVLAIDISIWIHQVIQGYQDRRGNMLPNAHLIGLFNRLCKLMYFKIKPVIVFDGGVPLLKRNTIAARRKLKSAAISKAEKLKNDLISNLIKHTAVKEALVKGNENSNKSPAKNSVMSIPSTSAADDMYKLPDMPSTSKIYDSDEELMSDVDNNELSPRKQSKWMGNIHSVNVNTEEFKNLPADVRYDILNDLKETRKQNSWAKVHDMPEGTHDYSGFQVKRLLKRRLVQESLEKAEKEMGGKTFTLEELDKLLTEQGISTTLQDDAYRIASDSTTRVVYINEQRESQIKGDSSSEKNPNKNLVLHSDDTSDSNSTLIDSTEITIDDSQYGINNLSDYNIDEFWESDEDFDQSTILNQTNVTKPDMNPAMNYMLEYSGLTPHQILKLIEKNQKEKKKSNDSSSKKLKKKRKSALSKNLKLEQKPNKNPKLDIEEIECNKIEKTDSGIISVNELSSDSEKSIEIVKDKVELDKTITKESSESDCDDFVTIEDVPIPDFTVTEFTKNIKQNNHGIQITVKPEEKIDNDLFADVFLNDLEHDVNTLNETAKIVTEGIKVDSLISHKSNDQISSVDRMENKLLKNNCKLNTENKNLEAEKFSDSESLNVNSSHLKNIHSSLESIEKNLDQQIEDSKNVEKQESFKEHKTDPKINVVSKAIEEKSVSLIQENFKENEGVNEVELEQNKLEIVIGEEIKQKSVLIHENLKENEQVNVEKLEQNKSKISTEEKSQKVSINLPVDDKELESMKKNLEMEQKDIRGVLGSLERQAVDITDQMRIEAQELLKLFGIPYIVAPMEAEAQCAYLEQINLVDGIITDDSDVWLFGGKCVYKHFFDNNKRVLQFLSQDIQHHFKLSRKEMIQLAILVGSDYTNGLMGVGPVTALEIMATFPAQGEDILCGLRNFSTWLKLGKLTAPEKNSLRNKLKNVQIEKGFPSQAVVQAYLNPALDESKEEFTWGNPNLVLLADYTRQKFGWTKLKFEEIMNPVMKKWNEKKSQSTINTYFKIQTIPKSIECNLSKRVQNALQKIGGTEDEEACKSNTINSKSTKKQKVKSKNRTTEETKSDADESNDLINEPNKLLKKTEDNEKANISRNTESQKTKKKLIITSTPDIDEIIPQREKDKVNALKTRLKAIEVYRKSKKGLGQTKKVKKVVRTVNKDAELSESDSSS